MPSAHDKPQPDALQAEAKGLWEWFQDVTWAIALALSVSFYRQYPFYPGRYAVYRVIIPAILLVGLGLTRSFRSAFRVTYERSDQPGRAMLWGLVPVILVYFAIAVSLIPPAKPAPRQARVEDAGATAPALIFMPSLPRQVEPPIAKAKKTARLKSHPPVPRVAEVIEDENPPRMDIEPPRLPEPEPLWVANLPTLPMPEPPIPPQRMPPPSAPMNVRIVR